MRLMILPAASMLALAVAGPSLAADKAPPPREVTSLADGWRFHFGDEGEAPAQSGFDDSQWQKVSVPHSWNRVGNYGPVRSADADNRQGLGWYRLAVDAPAAKKGQHQYLDFAAVSKVADVWVNGQHIGQHRGAFGRFRYDVTAQWKPGQANLIAVRADNSKPEPGKPTGETIPLAGDFFVHGGIYRPVTLITAGETGIDLLDHGGPGVYVRTVKVQPKFYEIAEHNTKGTTVENHMQATLVVQVRLRNAAKKARKLTATAEIVWKDCPTCAEVVLASQRGEKVKLPAGGTAATSIPLVWDDASIWDGAANPELGTVRITVRKGGKIVDQTSQTFGVRSTYFDPAKGFFLNGRHLDLHGVSRHQDRAGKGWALSDADATEDMAIARELGANTIRMAHYQHADAWADEADRAGMIAWAELPYVTTPDLTGGKGSDELWANAEEQLRELIRQNYNHPSIAMWSVGNEVDIAKAFGNVAAKPLPLLQHLAAVAKSEDPYRPTTFADCCEDRGLAWADVDSQLAGVTDLIGYNRYYGWYMPDPLEAKAQVGAELDRLHAKHPGLPMSISEWGAGAGISQHSDNIAAGFVNYMGRPQPEEFQTFIVQQNWQAMRSRKYLFATWLWNLFDFASDLRGEGDSFDINTKGLVTYDRKQRKDAFWYLKSQWNPAPMIWLSGKRHAVRAYPAMDVTAFTNAAKATLTWNGAKLPEVDCPDGICTWPGLALKPGENSAEVSATAKDGSAITDSATWQGPDVAKGLFVEAGDIAGHTVDGTLFGSDNFVTGGKAVVLNMGGFGARRSPPRKVEAAHPEFYDFWREGEAFSYALPVPDGKWTVTLHTFQPDASLAPTATMSVVANGKKALAPFNIAALAGGLLKGLDRRFDVDVKGGLLKLDFAGQGGGKAIVAALEVKPR